MDLSDFDFDLPEELIAQQPSAVRGTSRLLVLDRECGTLEHTVFPRLVDYLRPADLLVLNNTKVFPARLLGRRVPSGGAVECLLLRRLPPQQLPTSPFDLRSGRPERSRGPQLPAPKGEPGGLEVGQSGVGSSAIWDVLMHPGQKLKPGARVLFERAGVRLWGEVLARHFHGRRTIGLWADEGVSVATAIDSIGHVPLPPYIKREDRAADRERYQTVYARKLGSVAAPTAGLHFTSDALDALAARGVELVEVTLHVGYGTFKPMRTECVEDHRVDSETFTVSSRAADAITRARGAGRRVIAVGTTTARALESVTIGPEGRIEASHGDTDLFIRPGHVFRIVNGLLTNFHLPRSSLLILVAAFAGRERILAAYREAIARGYRFYSYGDAMLIT